MAEFKTIMNGWKNICSRSADCSDCPIKGRAEGCSPVEHLDENAIASIESAVLAETPVWTYCGPHPLGLNFNCSVCGGRSNTPRKFCPDCGRKMLIK